MESFKFEREDKEKEDDNKKEVKHGDNPDKLKISFLRRLGIIPTWMLSKTSMCKHKHGCYHNVIVSFYNIFMKSLAFKVIIANITSIFNVKKLIKNLTSWK